MLIAEYDHAVSKSASSRDMTGEREPTPRIYRDNIMGGYGVNVHETKSQSIQG
jgi:hypothetical protein